MHGEMHEMDGRCSRGDER